MLKTIFLVFCTLALLGCKEAAKPKFEFKDPDGFDKFTIALTKSDCRTGKMSFADSLEVANTHSCFILQVDSKGNYQAYSELGGENFYKGKLSDIVAIHLIELVRKHRFKVKDSMYYSEDPPRIYDGFNVSIILEKDTATDYSFKEEIDLKEIKYIQELFKRKLLSKVGSNEYMQKYRYYLKIYLIKSLYAL